MVDDGRVPQAEPGSQASPSEPKWVAGVNYFEHEIGNGFIQSADRVVEGPHGTLLVVDSEGLFLASFPSSAIIIANFIRPKTASAIDAGTGETADAGSIAEGDESAAAKPDAQTPAPKDEQP